MDIRMAKKNNQVEVGYKGHTYILNACILRKNKNGWFYQAELKDLFANSVVITSLEKVEEITAESEEQDNA